MEDYNNDLQTLIALVADMEENIARVKSIVTKLVKNSSNDGTKNDKPLSIPNIDNIKNGAKFEDLEDVKNHPKDNPEDNELSIDKYGPINVDVGFQEKFDKDSGKNEIKGFVSVENGHKRLKSVVVTNTHLETSETDSVTNSMVEKDSNNAAKSGPSLTYASHNNNANTNEIPESKSDDAKDLSLRRMYSEEVSLQILLSRSMAKESILKTVISKDEHSFEPNLDSENDQSGTKAKGEPKKDRILSTPKTNGNPMTTVSPGNDKEHKECCVFDSKKVTPEKTKSRAEESLAQAQPSQAGPEDKSDDCFFPKKMIEQVVSELRATFPHYANSHFDACSPSASSPSTSSSEVTVTLHATPKRSPSASEAETSFFWIPNDKIAHKTTSAPSKPITAFPVPSLRQTILNVSIGLPLFNHRPHSSLLETENVSSGFLNDLRDYVVLQNIKIPSPREIRRVPGLSHSELGFLKLQDIRAVLKRRTCQHGKTSQNQKCSFCGEAHFSEACHKVFRTADRLERTKENNFNRVCLMCLGLKKNQHQRYCTKPWCGLCDTNSHHSAFCYETDHLIDMERYLSKMYPFA